MATFNLEADLKARGLVFQQTDDELFTRLEAQPTSVYCGFDPTADSLHVGNLLMLCTLRRFQMAGHRPIALAGGATGMVGDPGGRSEERNLLEAEQLSANLSGIKVQLAKFLDFTDAAGAAKAVQLDNASWLGGMSILTFLRDVGKHFTVNEMVAKDSVKSRFERPDHGISYTEFSYMLLQAADFLHLFRNEGCTVQIGGSDQWGNITMGTSLIRKVTGQLSAGVTMPLVTKADGTKFGKSVDGAVWLDRNRTSPYQLFQFFVGADDQMVGAYLRYFTFLDLEEIERLDAATKEHPERREAQRALALEVTSLVHSREDATRAEAASAALFSGTLAQLDQAALEAVVADVPTSSLHRSALEATVEIVSFIVDAGLVRSRAEARRSIEQGGLYLNDERVVDAEARVSLKDLLHDAYVVLRKGRRQYHVVIVQ